MCTIIYQYCAYNNSHPNRQTFLIFLLFYVSRIPINIIDRIISVFAGFGIAYIIAKITGKISRKARKQVN